MTPTILYRRGALNSLASDQEETEAIKRVGFKLIHFREQIEKNDYICCRYSTLPYYSDLLEDTIYNKAKIINDFSSHSYVQDLRNWTLDFEGMTPRTWDRFENLPDDGTQFVIKGEVSSRKFEWNTMMFAPNKKTAIDIQGKLQKDSLIGTGNIYAREYVPLKNYLIGINGLPITHEFRYFILDGKIISSGYYWSNYEQEVKEIIVSPIIEPSIPQEFLDRVCKVLSEKIRFVVADIALTKDNKPILIELNDAQNSGLSCNSPETLYQNLFKEMSNDFF